MQVIYDTYIGTCSDDVANARVCYLRVLRRVHEYKVWIVQMLKPSLKRKFSRYSRTIRKGACNETVMEN